MKFVKKPYEMMGKVVMLALLALAAAGANAQEPDCVLKKEADSIRIYACKVEESKFRSVRAELTLNSRLDQFVSVMLDIDNYVNWQYNAVKSSVIQRLGDDEVIYYVEVEAPWPASNRDVVVHLKVNRESDSTAVSITTASVTGYLPEKENIVRIPLSRAHWKATAIGPGRLQLEYHMQIDPGGSVPAWMVNLIASEGPYESFRDLRKQLQAKK